MNDSEMSNLKIAIMTINEHEAAAVSTQLGRPQGATRPLAANKYAYNLTSYVRNGLTIDHVACTCSGNLPAALVTYQHFHFNGGYSAVILYGCAGLNPLRTDSGLKLGDAVLVQKVDYYENGDIRTTMGSDGRMGDYFLAKVDRFSVNRIELSGELLVNLTSEGLSRRTALCGDKILKINTAINVPQPANKHNGFATYRDLLEMEYDIVEMESYGFLNALDEQTRACAIVIRVITDQLSDHHATEGAEKQSKGANQGENQRRLLVNAAKEVLLPAIDKLGAALSETGTDWDPMPTSAKSRPVTPHKATPPNAGKGSPRPRGSAPTESKQMLQRTLRDSMMPISPDDLATRLAVSAHTLVRTNPEALKHESREVKQLVYDLSDFQRYGYGTLRLANNARGSEIPRFVRDSMRRVLPTSQRKSETLRRWNEIFSAYDPTRSQEAYTAAVHAAVKAHGIGAAEIVPLGDHIGVELRTPTKQLILVPTKYSTHAAAAPSSTPAADIAQPTQIVAWDGFESDRKLRAAIFDHGSENKN